MAGKERFFRFLDMLVNEDERVKVLKEFLEEKTGYSVYVEKVGIPGITESFELHNIKCSSPNGKVRINAELLRLHSSQLYSLIAAGKILLNSKSDIPLEGIEGHGLFFSLGEEDDPDLEFFSPKALFKGIALKIRYDEVTHEPEFTGTLSSEKIEGAFTLKQKGTRLPEMKGDADLTINLKSLMGRGELRIAGRGKENNNSGGKGNREIVSFDSISFKSSFEFTLFPGSV